MGVATKKKQCQQNAAAIYNCEYIIHAKEKPRGKDTKVTCNEAVYQPAAAKAISPRQSIDRSKKKLVYFTHTKYNTITHTHTHTPFTRR